MHNRSMYFVTFIATMNHHNETPLAKSGKVTMKASRLRSLCVQIFKSINSNQHWRINVKVRYIDLKFLMTNINYVITSKSYFFEFLISLDKLLMYSIKIIHKNDLKKYIILQNQNELLLTKTCCRYLSEDDELFLWYG